MTSGDLNVFIVHLIPLLDELGFIALGVFFPTHESEKCALLSDGSDTVRLGVCMMNLPSGVKVGICDEV